MNTPQITIFKEMAELYKKEVDRPENIFSNDQKRELHQLLENIKSLSDDPKKYRKAMKQYEGMERQFVEKFEAFGGNCEKVNESVCEFENNAIPTLLKTLKGAL